MIGGNVSASNDSTAPRATFRASAWDGSGTTTPGEFFTPPTILPSARDLSPIKVSPLFAAAMEDRRCPVCDFYSEDWQSPAPATERVLHFNATQSAILNTVAEALARMYGADEWRVRLTAAVAELARLFLLTEPAMLAMKFHERTARSERGAVSQTPFKAVEVVADPVAPPADQPETVEGELEDGIDSLYDEPGNPDKLYGDSGEKGGLYGDKEKE